MDDLTLSFSCVAKDRKDRNDRKDKKDRKDRKDKKDRKDRKDRKDTSIVLLRSPTTICWLSQTIQLTPSPHLSILMPGPSSTHIQKSFSMTTPVLSQVMRTPLSQWMLWTGPLCPVRARTQVSLLAETHQLSVSRTCQDLTLNTNLL